MDIARLRATDRRQCKANTNLAVLGPAAALYLWCFMWCFVPTAAIAQTSAADPEAEARSVLEDAPIMSARTAGMGGAIAPLADDLDATFHNPAGIGGQGWGKKTSVPWIRKLYFPWLGAAANEQSAELYQEMRRSKGDRDNTIGQAVLDAHAGKRQYARASVATGMVLGRAIIVPYSDLQVAATPQGNGTGLIDTKYRSTSGLGFGTSVSDAEGRLALGYFGYAANRQETQGVFLYDDLVNPATRSQLISDNSTSSSALGHNAGITWRMGKVAAPTLAVVATDIGDTRFSASGAEDTIIEQDLNLAFGLSGSLGKHFVTNFVLQGSRLQDEGVTLAKKFRLGLELLYKGVGTGSYATFGLRSGINDAGPAGGLSINLGLISLEAAIHSVDIGVGNEKVVERRGIGIFSVNVAEF